MDIGGHYFKYVATIKDFAPLPDKLWEEGRSIKQKEQLRTYSGTWGVGSLPKKDDCSHHTSKFLCAFCNKMPFTPPTKGYEAPDCSGNTCPTSNPPLSLNGTSGMYPASFAPSPLAFDLSFPDEAK